MDPIEPDMKVATVIDRYPAATNIFFDYDCPDMRSGFFRMMAQLMSVRAAAWIHGIPLEELMNDLNEVAAAREQGSPDAAST